MDSSATKAVTSPETWAKTHDKANGEHVDPEQTANMKIQIEQTAMRHDPREFVV